MNQSIEIKNNNKTSTAVPAKKSALAPPRPSRTNVPVSTPLNIENGQKTSNEGNAVKISRSGHESVERIPSGIVKAAQSQYGGLSASPKKQYDLGLLKPTNSQTNSQNNNNANEFFTSGKSSTTAIKQGLLNQGNNSISSTAKVAVIKKTRNNENNQVVDENLIPDNFNEQLMELEKLGVEYLDLVYYLEDWAVRIESEKVDLNKLVKDEAFPIFESAKKSEEKVKELKAFYALMMIMDEDPKSDKNTMLSSFLEKYKLDVNYYSPVIGRTLLHEAVLYGKLVSVKTLLSLGANPRVRNKSNRTPLMIAFFKDIINVKPLEDVNEVIIKALINANGNPMAVVDSFGKSVEAILTESLKLSKSKHIDKKYKTIKEMLEIKSTVKDEETSGKKLDKTRLTAPIPITPKQMHDQLKKIADKYPDLMMFFERISSNGKKLSEKSPNSELAKKIIKAMHRVRRANRHERKIIKKLMAYFEKLLKSNKFEKAQTFVGNLKNYNINLNLVDKNDESFLHKAVFERDVQMIDYLLMFGIDCNLQDKFGRTALHYLFLKNEVVISLDQVSDEILFKLLKNSDITIQDKDGKTVVDYFKNSFDCSSKNEEVCVLNNKTVEKFDEILAKDVEICGVNFSGAKQDQDGVLNRVKFSAVKAINDGKYLGSENELKVLADKLLSDSFKEASGKISARERKSLEKSYEEFKNDLFEKIDSNYFEQYVKEFNGSAEVQFQQIIKPEFEAALKFSCTKFSNRKDLMDALEGDLDAASRRISPYISQAKIAEYKMELKRTKDDFLKIKESSPQSPTPGLSPPKVDKSASFLVRKKEVNKEENSPLSYRDRSRSLKGLIDSAKKSFLRDSDEKLKITQHEAVKKEISSPSSST